MKPHGAHLNENVLLDYRGSAQWTHAVERHVASCELCAAKLQEWQRAADHARDLLHTAAAPDTVVASHARRFDPIPPPRSHRPWFGLVAAAVPLGFLILFSVAPVRAWVVEQWRAIVTRSSAESDPPPTSTPDTTPAGTAILSFVPAGDRFTVGFDHAQSEGVVTLQAAPGQEVSVRVLATPRGDNVLVTPSGIRVRNTDASRVSYLVSVPPGVATITVTVEGGAVRTVSREELMVAEVTVPLGAP